MHAQVGPPQPPQIPMESSPYRQTGSMGVTVGPQPPSQPAAHVQVFVRMKQPGRPLADVQVFVVMNQLC